MTKKLFVTGGHLTPALAVIDEILYRGESWEIVFIGRTGTMEGKRDISREEHTVQAKGVRFMPMITGRLQRAFTLYSLISLFKIPVGFAQAIYYCLTERPQGVLSFGGYVALPVVIAASLFRIPVITHEQTSVPGLANRIIALFARKICVTFEETVYMFPKNKVVFTGLPVRKELFESTSALPLLGNGEKYPIIYITGGSTGSVSLNALLFPLISQLTKRFAVVHQTGRLSYEDASWVKQALAGDQKSRYIIRDYFDPEAVGWIMQHAALVVGRSGANTVIEVAISGVMALFIPLPWSGGGEQTKNAQWLEKHGSARVVFQKKTNSSDILHIIQQMIKGKNTYTQLAKKLSKHIPRNAAERLVDELELILQ